MSIAAYSAVSADRRQAYPDPPLCPTTGRPGRSDPLTIASAVAVAPSRLVAFEIGPASANTRAAASAPLTCRIHERRDPAPCWERHRDQVPCCRTGPRKVDGWERASRSAPRSINALHGSRMVFRRRLTISAVSPWPALRRVHVIPRAARIFSASTRPVRAAVIRTVSPSGNAVVASPPASRSVSDIASCHWSPRARRRHAAIDSPR